jgi:hypothetical protein
MSLRTGAFSLAGSFAFWFAGGLCTIFGLEPPGAVVVVPNGSDDRGVTSGGDGLAGVVVAGRDGMGEFIACEIPMWAIVIGFLGSYFAPTTSDATFIISATRLY